MRRASVLAALIVSVFAVQSASAAVIGVRGGDSGSPPATDGSAFALSPCDLTGEDSTQYFCKIFENTLEEDIYALDLAFWDADGQPIQALVFDGEFFFFENFEKAPESDFQLISFFPQDPYLVRLCTDEVGAGTEACAGDFGDDPVIPAGFFRVFADFKGFVSIQGVNEIDNLNPAPRGQQIPVPEPGTLLLLGLGIATAAGRRFRNRRQ
jgi:hypothetical protein